jgi:hypothetical protein
MAPRIKSAIPTLATHIMRISRLSSLLSGMAHTLVVVVGEIIAEGAQAVNCDNYRRSPERSAVLGISDDRAPLFVSC